MRKQILALSVLGSLLGSISGVVGIAEPAYAGLITSPHPASMPADPADVADEASQQAEQELGLTKTKRRQVQRQLVKLGFGAKVNGRFDETTRDAIAHWQEGHGFAKTGYLDATQHRELLSEVATPSETGDADRPSRRRGGGRARHARGGGGPIGVITRPIGAIGHAVTGIFH